MQKFHTFAVVQSLYGISTRYYGEAQKLASELIAMIQGNPRNKILAIKYLLESTRGKDREIEYFAEKAESYSPARFVGGPKQFYRDEKGNNVLSLVVSKWIIEQMETGNWTV